MRKWLVFVLLLGVLITATPVGAQGRVDLKNVNIGLWSEYDQPSMLVIHEFLVDENTPLPAKVIIRFPKDGNLTAAAYKDQDGKLITTAIENLETEGDWQILTMNVESYLPYRIEYYQPLTRDGNKRSFTYQWFGDYPVNEFSLEARIPANSTNVTSDPAFTATSTAEQGKVFIGTVTRQGLQMGQAGEYKLAYERESESITQPANSDNIQPSEPIGPSTKGRISIDELPWIIGALGLALIGLALFFYWRSTQGTEQKTRQRRRSNNRQEQEASGEQAYCHECGTRAQSGDRFCRTCGSKLRI